jgi:hypothetical protein
MATDLVADIRHLDTAIADIKARTAVAVTASGTCLAPGSVEALN